MAEPIEPRNPSAHLLAADGERFLPGIMAGEIELEHLHRYKFAAQLSAKKVVLDIASGEGYGSALLSRSARRVYGVDISPEAIESAQEKYQQKNLKFIVGSATKIPLAKASIDLVVSFETIEHLADHEGMMREIKRVLRPGGTLVISSPDKLEFSDKPGAHNPFHVKELYREEFQSLLADNFKHVHMFGQKVLEGSVLFGESGTVGVEVHELGTESASRDCLKSPKYLLALASDVQLPRAKGGILEGDPTKREAVVEGAGSKSVTSMLRAIAMVNSECLRAKLTDSWYLQRNPDVVSKGIDPVSHWLEWGAKEGRLPAQNVEGLARELMAEREQSLRQTIEEKNQELRRGVEEALEQQRVLENENEQTRLRAREEVAAHLGLLAERERVMGEQLAQQQRLAGEDRENQRQTAEQRLQTLQSEQEQRQEQLRAALAEKERTIVELQRESAARLHVLESQFEQQRSASREQLAKRERELEAQLEQQRSASREQLAERERELEAQLEQQRSASREQLAERERGSGAQLEQQRTASREQLAERERVYAEQCEQLRSEAGEVVEANLRAMIERERSFAETLTAQQLQASAERDAQQESASQRLRLATAQHEEHEKSLRLEIAEKEREYRNLQREAADQRKVLEDGVAQQRLAVTYATESHARALAERDRALSEQIALYEQRASEERAAERAATQSQLGALQLQHKEQQERLVELQRLGAEQLERQKLETSQELQRASEERAAERAATQSQLSALQLRDKEQQERLVELQRLGAEQLERQKLETSQELQRASEERAAERAATQSQLSALQLRHKEQQERLVELQRHGAEQLERQKLETSQELQRVRARYEEREASLRGDLAESERQLHQGRDQWLVQQRALEVKVENAQSWAREQFVAQLRAMLEREQAFQVEFARLRDLVDKERRFLRDQYLHTARATLETLDEMRRARWWHRIRAGAGTTPASGKAVVAWAALREHIEGIVPSDNLSGSPSTVAAAGPERSSTGTAPRAKLVREASSRASSVAELVAHEGADFVTCAYLTLLGRRPDAQGFAHYTELLRRTGDKAVVIQRISSSEEARRRGIGLKGLKAYLRRERWKSVPVLGDLVAGIEHGRPAEIVRPILEQIEQQVEALEREISGSIAQFESNKLTGVSLQVGAVFASFDVQQYLAENPDVAKSGLNPYEHFIRFGWYEGRRMPEAARVASTEVQPQAVLGRDIAAVADGRPAADDSGSTAANAGEASSEALPLAGDSKWRCVMDVAPELPRDTGLVLTRLMRHVWRGREDLRRTFDIEQSVGRLGFLKWLVLHGTAEFGLTVKVFPPELLRELAAVDSECNAIVDRALRAQRAIDQERSGAKTEIAADEPGIGANLVGYAYGEFGRGEDVRMVARSLHVLDVPFGIINQDAGSHGQRDGSVAQWVTEVARFSTNIFLINADLFPFLPVRLGEKFAAGRYNIGYWAWELSGWPAEFELALDMVDEVWAISDFVADSVRSRARVPVIRMPNAVTVPKLGSGYTKARYGIPADCFAFYFIFDAASHIERKNPIGVVRAFKLAFQGDIKAHLLLKAMNIEAAGPTWDELLREVANSPNITILAERLTREEVLGLNLACDAFVSLHRSEGFGRCVAEAMAYGRPVIVTNYSGTRDFAREGTACVVDYQLIPVPAGAYPFSDNQVWADPDVEHAAALMRRIACDPLYRDVIAGAGQKFVRENFNPEAVGRLYAQRLSELRPRPTQPAPASGPAPDTSGQPKPEIRGNVDAPSSAQCREASEVLSIEGWVASLDGIESVKVSVDSKFVADAHYGVLRPDIHDAFPEYHASGRSGYCYLLNIADLEDGAHSFSVVATSRAGATKSWANPFTKRSSFKYQEWLRKTEALYEARIAAEGHQSADVLVSLVLRLPESVDNLLLVQSLKSLATQGYKRFEVLCFVAGLAQEKQVANAARRAKLRVRPRCIAGDGADWAAIASHCQGDLIGVLEPGDTFRTWALDQVVQAAREAGPLDVLYGDEDIRDQSGNSRPVFKPGWSPIFLNHYNYIGRAWFVSRVALVSALAERLAGADDLDGYGLLRLLGGRNAAVAHVPTVLLTRVGHAEEKYVYLNASQPESAALAAGPLPKVSIIIPTRLGDEQIIAKCFDGLEQQTDYPDFEVIVVVNNLPDATAVGRLLGPRPFKVLKWDGAFSWSGINNAGAAAAGGELLLFMNDDIEPLGKDWLRKLVGTLMQTGAGAAGCLLRYPNGTIQHAGVNFVNYGGGARHLFRFCTGQESSLDWLLKCPREVSAVTGACLLTSRDCFEQLGGFDEELPLVCNDTDYCLRVWDSGRSVVMAPEAQLIHYEGVSRAGMSEANDVEKFWAKWGEYVKQGDIFSNPNLDETRDDWAVSASVERTYKVRIRSRAPAVANGQRVVSL